METININLELWQNPNFPPIDILESRTKTALEAFNKCRKLDIKLQTNDGKIKKFNPLFNSLTERRATESLRLSMYAEDVFVYIKLLSEENTSAGVILETLLSLSNAAHDRRETTRKLKKDYQEFLENFNNEVVANIKINSKPNSNQLVVRNQGKAPTKRILVLEIIVPVLVGVGVGYGYYRFSQSSSYGSFLSILLLKYLLHEDEQNVTTKDGGSSSSSDNVSKEETHTNKEKIQDSSSSPQNIKKNNSEEPSKITAEKLDRPKASTTSSSNNVNDSNRLEEIKNSSSSNISDGIDFNDSSIDEWKSRNPISSDNVSDIRWVGRLKKWLPFGKEDENDQSSENHLNDKQEQDNMNKQVSENDQSSENHLNDKQDNMNKQVNMNDIPDESKLENTSSDGLLSGNETQMDSSNLLSSGYTDTRLYLAAFIGIFCGLLVLRILRRKRNDNKYKSRRISEEQQQSIEKNAKIMEIKEKLPVIIQNVEILDQFWDNQIINIRAHIETLESVNENTKINFPKEIAAPIKEDWDKQFKECKANFIRMKELVTRNSIISID